MMSFKVIAVSAFSVFLASMVLMQGTSGINSSSSLPSSQYEAPQEVIHPSFEPSFAMSLRSLKGGLSRREITQLNVRELEAIRKRISAEDVRRV